MSIKIYDHIHGATTHCAQPVPQKLRAALDMAGVDAPVAGAKLDLDDLDDNMAGLDIETRMEVKTTLRQAGFLA